MTTEILIDTLNLFVDSVIQASLIIYIQYKIKAEKAHVV